MTLHINQTTQFKKDIKRLRRQGKDLVTLFQLISLLAEEEPLPACYFDHNLIGNWRGYRECHIRPDWLLIYRVEGIDLYLARTGSHSDLF